MEDLVMEDLVSQRYGSRLAVSGVLEPDVEIRSSTLGRRCPICSCSSLMVTIASATLLEVAYESILARGVRGSGVSRHWSGCPIVKWDQALVVKMQRGQMTQEDSSSKFLSACQGPTVGLLATTEYSSHMYQKDAQADHGTGELETP